MKSLKMFGLAAAVAMALMAFAGAGTASAGGVLCEDTGEPCETKWKLEAHMPFELKTGSSSKLTTTGGGLLRKCAASKLTGRVIRVGTAAERAAAEIQTGWLTFGECEGTVQKNVTPGHIELEWRKAEKGTKGTVYASGLVITAQVMGVHCYYKTGSALDIGLYTPGAAEGKGGTLAVNTVLSLENSATHPSSFLCPTSAVWHVEYTLTGITPLYLK